MRRTIAYTPDDRAQSIYQYVPFDLPAGSSAVSIELHYDTSRAVVDLGLFGPEGFRGWSGGARDHVVVSRSEATPGYLPGPLAAGTWQVILGLHRIPDDGVSVTLDVEARATPAPVATSPTPPPRPDRPPRRSLPAAPGHSWVAADLHSHSVHSDGALSLEGLADLATRRGLDVLAVTDHNTVSHHPHLPAVGRQAGLLLLPGQEVTSDTGHANCLGDIGWIDFRGSADSWLETARGRGGVVSVNHPLAGDCAWRRPLDASPDLVELWHSSWDRRSRAPLDLWSAGVGIVGGSDFHRPGSDALPGAPTTWLELEGVVEEVDAATVVEALRGGRTTISRDPAGPVLIRRGDVVLAIDAAGLDLCSGTQGRRGVGGARVELSVGDGPCWLEDDDGTVHAVTA